MAAVTAGPYITTDNFSGTASVTSATSLVSVEVNGFDRCSIQVTDAGTTCTISYEVSNDNSTWVAVGGYAPATPATETVTTSTSTGMTVFRLDARYFRAHVSTYGSGTPTIYFHFRSIYTSD